MVGAIVPGRSPHEAFFTASAMQDEWTKLISGNRLVKFTCEDLGNGGTFLTAQLAGHEVVYSVLLAEAELPFTRDGVERHFARELELMTREWLPDKPDGQMN